MGKTKKYKHELSAGNLAGEPLGKNPVPGPKQVMLGHCLNFKNTGNCFFFNTVGIPNVDSSEQKLLGCIPTGFCLQRVYAKDVDHVSWSRIRRGRRSSSNPEKTRQKMRKKLTIWSVGDSPNTVSEGTVSNTELTEFFGDHRVPGRELNECRSANYLCAKANSPSFLAELAEFAAELSELSLPKQYSRNSLLPVS